MEIYSLLFKSMEQLIWKTLCWAPQILLEPIYKGRKYGRIVRESVNSIPRRCMKQLKSMSLLHLQTFPCYSIFLYCYKFKYFYCPSVKKGYSTGSKPDIFKSVPRDIIQTCTSSYTFIFNSTNSSSQKSKVEISLKQN